jgi:hypothetical protein
MNQDSLTPEKPATRAPVFFWITVSLLSILLLAGAAVALLLVHEAKSINRSGGWGWLLVGGIYVAATTVVCFACALCTAVSLFRRETHRRVSIAILIISCLEVLLFGPNLVRVVNGLRRQHTEVDSLPRGAPRPPADSLPRLPVPPSADKSSNAPVLRQGEDKQILELKSKLWEAIRTRNADSFVDCFFIEERFNTPKVREANRNQVEILLTGETIDMEIRDIPDKEMVQIMKIQNAKPESLVRYSLVPRMMLWIRQKAQNGTIGRGFLIGEQNGKWALSPWLGIRLSIREIIVQLLAQGSHRVDIE